MRDSLMADVLRRAGAAPLIQHLVRPPEEPHESSEGNWIDSEDDDDA